jgi:general secretion pathway protein A
MYKEYFGLKDPPFSIAPDPHYLYMSNNHREALAHLLYGINSDNGFVLLTGDVGTGKTTVCRCLLQQLPENSNIAFIINPKLSVDELLAVICDELDIIYPAGNTSNKIFIDNINNYLIEANTKGRRTVLIIEEAQNLSPDVLEQIRLLTNLETNERKLLQIILVGQPELNDILAKPELKQLQQRITARFHLGPLTKKELAPYVLHRLSVAGVDRKLFAQATIAALFRLSRGIPRKVNLICDRALLGTYVQGKSMVDMTTLNKAADEVLGIRDERGVTKKIFNRAFASIILVICAAALAAAFFGSKTKDLEPETTRLPVQNPDSSNVRLQSWQDDLIFEGNQVASFQSLYSLWNISSEGVGDFCKHAESMGLRCMKGLGSLSHLLKINRPAVLKLYDDQGGEFYLMLMELKNETAVLQFGTTIRAVRLKEVENRWLGEYTLLWKVPPQYRGDIHPGMEGEDVKWVDLQLARIYGRTQERGSFIYNRELETRVKRFQLSQGLTPDGIIGPMTVIHLNTAAGTAGPRLMQ